MSVINQMLKDLDKRQEQEKLASSHQVPSRAPKSNTSIAIVSTAITTLILVALVYLFIENRALKDNQTGHTTVTQEKKTQVSVDETSVSEKGKITVSETTAAPEQTGLSSTDEVIAPASIEQTANTEDTSTKEIEPTNSVVKTEEKAVEQPAVQHQKEKEDKGLSEVNAESDTATLSISRKKLTPEELSTKKMAQAEQAILDNNIQDAERLFEEILLLQSSHVAARKQLAALLYGRQATQQAINILAQGVALNPHDSDLRLMQARIYLDKGYQEQAFDTLNRLNQTMQVEYQSLLATVAQSLSRFEEAKQAYAKLIQLQGNQGRWYLGLAISHDSLAEYKEAYNAYESALAIGGLSTSALDFAKQRKLELGE